MNYAILGKGKSGQAAYNFLNSVGEKAVLLDDSDQSLTLTRVLAQEAVVLSPGISRQHLAVQGALDAGMPIYNELDLGALRLPNCSFVGITGTNGKSTTTALLGHIVKTFERHTFVGGNLGRPLCEALSQGEKPSYAILELSSFQLETISKLSLDVAVLLNLSPDHLDRYESPEAYYQTKYKIFDLLKLGGTRIELPSSILPEGFTGCPRLLGVHNVQNTRAAILAAQALKIPDTQIQKAILSFAGIAHRLEILGQKNGVTWINDSKATNIESVMAALSCFESGLHLILGGIGKGSNYEPLVQKARGIVKSVYLIGEEAEVLEQAFDDRITIFQTATLENATRLAYTQAKPGETVLLSPACASYDQFKNFEHRGDVFRSLFHAL